jgi:CheY-like chemotaxis protein
MKQPKTSKELRVLVADDDISIRQLVRTIITREDIAVDTAGDGREAIALLEEGDYAVILLDLMMPRVDGFGVIEHLRLHPQKRKPVVLVITAYADQKFKHVDPSVVSGVLRKPFEVADLGALVRLCVQGMDSVTPEELLRASDRSIRELAERQWNASVGFGEDSGSRDRN